MTPKPITHTVLQRIIPFLFLGCAVPAALAQGFDFSGRANVGVQENVLVTEFVVQGTASTDVLVRGLAPSLANTTGAMTDPFMELRDQNGTVLEFNDDWQQSARSSAIQSSGLAPSNPKESAILRNLLPGMYSVVVRGVKNSAGFPTTGLAVTEVYDYATGTQLIPAIGSRGNVGTGDSVLITGLGISGTSRDVLGRMLGASLNSPQ